MHLALATAALLAALVPTTAQAHGLWGHIHVTGWAVENMEEDDELRRFLTEDPEVFNALLMGAVFTDSGYARDVPASRAYAEHAHWEPYVEDYIRWMEVNDPPPWTTLESKKRVAFLLGCASHGLQDSIFDSLFIYQTEERDDASQDATDPGTDGFLALDDHLRFFPEEDIPMDTVLQLMSGLSEDVTRDVIEDSLGLVMLTYINPEIGIPVAKTFGEQYTEVMPWGRDHYMDAGVPGSLRSEIYPTMRYQQAVWKRLHGELTADDAVVWAYPGAARLRDGNHEKVDSWVTLIFGAGVSYEGDLVELLDAEGRTIPITQGNTRWGANHTRLVRILPEEDLQPGAWYTARLRAGITLIDGQTSTEAWETRFQVSCLDPDDGRCAALPWTPVPRIDGQGPSKADDETGCSCATAPLGGAGWIAGLFALIGLRRR